MLFALTEDEQESHLNSGAITRALPWGRGAVVARWGRKINIWHWPCRSSVLHLNSQLWRGAKPIHKSRVANCTLRSRQRSAHVNHIGQACGRVDAKKNAGHLPGVFVYYFLNVRRLTSPRPCSRPRSQTAPTHTTSRAGCYRPHRARTERCHRCRWHWRHTYSARSG